jgi:hypothetical protein
MKIIMLAVTFLAFCLAAQPAPTAIHALLPSGVPQASDAACQSVIAALEKNLTTPYQIYMTHTNAALHNGKPVISETVFVGGVKYVMVNAKWTTIPVSTEDNKTIEAEIRKNSTCHYVRDESVNGESTTLFAMHTYTDDETSDNQIWISKSKGLILKQESDIEISSNFPKTHASARYEYSNVVAPKM